MQLYLIDGYVRPKARLDWVFRVKQDMTDLSLVFADYRHWDAWEIPNIKNKTWFETYEYRIRKYYYDIVQVMDFDNLLYKQLRSYAPEMMDDYYLLEFNEDVLQIANNIAIRPPTLSPPLYYQEGVIKTLYAGKFWGKFDRDVYRHETLTVRKDGIDHFFAHLQKDTHPFPIWTQPYLTVGKLEKQFGRFKTTHREAYQIMKGLLSLWSGLKF